MITTQQIQSITDVIVQTVQPEKVFLFGSYSNGTATNDSDLDLLVVVKQPLNKAKRIGIMSQLALNTVDEFLFPKDFKVYSTQEFEERKNNQYSFLYHILKEAKSLYVR